MQLKHIDENHSKHAHQSKAKQYHDITLHQFIQLIATLVTDRISKIQLQQHDDCNERDLTTRVTVQNNEDVEIESQLKDFIYFQICRTWCQ